MVVEKAVGWVYGKVEKLVAVKDASWVVGKVVLWGG